MGNQTEDRRDDHYKICPTAKLVSYWRAQSDIPYSAEISEAIGAEQTAIQILGGRIPIITSIAAPLLETRYKCINQGLRKMGLDNVLEVASGLSPRGLQLAANNCVYVGTDLLEMSAESSPLLKDIALRQGIPTENLYLQPANVLDKGQLEDAVKHFKGKRFGICNEGLMLYLCREEQATMAKHIRDLLTGAGGSWVTPDITDNESREKMINSFGPEFRKLAESVIGGITSQTERNIVDNYFPNEAEAMKFFQNLGFAIETFPMYDKSYALSTLSRIPENMRETIIDLLSARKAWILTPRQ